MTRTLRNAALSAALTVVLFGSPASLADQPANSPGGGAPLTADRLRSDFNALSPQARAVLIKQLRATGDSSTLTSQQMQSAFDGLPSDVQAELRQKWDSLSEEQKAALKKMNPAALRQLVMDQLKQMLKPAEGAVQKVKDFVHKLRDTLFGHGDS